MRVWVRALVCVCVCVCVHAHACGRACVREDRCREYVHGVMYTLLKLSEYMTQAQVLMRRQCAGNHAAPCSALPAVPCPRAAAASCSGENV